MNDAKPEENVSDVSDDRKTWETPELVVEDVSRVTRGGTGRLVNLAPPEERTTTYYTS